MAQRLTVLLSTRGQREGRNEQSEALFIVGDKGAGADGAALTYTGLSSHLLGRTCPD